MRQQPTTVDWANGDAVNLFAGNLVVQEDSANGHAILTFGSELVGPVGIVTGVPAAGVVPGNSFSAVLSGEAIVLMEPGLPTLAPGQRLYVSPTVAGRATNVRPDDEVFPIGVIRSIQSDTTKVLAVIGALSEKLDHIVATWPITIAGVQQVRYYLINNDSGDDMNPVKGLSSKS